MADRSQGIAGEISRPLQCDPTTAEDGMYQVCQKEKRCQARGATLACVARVTYRPHLMYNTLSLNSAWGTWSLARSGPIVERDSSNITVKAFRRSGQPRH